MTIRQLIRSTKSKIFDLMLHLINFSSINYKLLSYLLLVVI